jgi:hypothetical protein
MNKNGATRCTGKDQERYEYFKMGYGKKAKKMVQYDYRNQEGELFSCVAPTLEKARQKKENYFNRIVLRKLF